MFLNYFRAPKPWESLTQEPRPGMRSSRWISQNSSENVIEYHICKNFKNHNWRRHQHHQGWDHKLLHWRGCQSTWGFRLFSQIRWWSWREPENPGKQCKSYESKLIKYFLWTVCDQNQQNFHKQGDDLGNVTEVQLRWRTLAGFSTAAEQKMSGQVTHEKIWQIILMNWNILQMMFELFNDYYGLPDYADEVLDIIYDSHFTNPSSS